jgi:integrase
MISDKTLSSQINCQNKKRGICHSPTPRNCLELDQLYLDGYVQSKKSDSTQRKVRQNLYFFYNFIIDSYPSIKSILEVDPLMFRAFFTHLENQSLQKVGKNKYRQNLKAYIYWIISPDLALGIIPKINYELVFSQKFHKFTQTTPAKDDIVLSREDIFNCLKFFQGRNFRDYIMFSLLAFTGMRVGGLVSILIDDIDLHERRLKSQEKPTEDNLGLNEYFFPKSFIWDLEAYIMEIKAKYPNQTQLFPITEKAVRIQLRNWNNLAHPHLFRDAINTRRFEMGLMDDALRGILLNQSPNGKSINSRHYLKKYLKSWEARRELYDQYFPY